MEARSAASPHQLAYGILVAARGEREADDIWNEWTPTERRAVAAFTDAHFGPIIRKCCADIVAWKDALAAAKSPVAGEPGGAPTSPGSTTAALPHGEMFDLSEHLAAALDIAERLDREQESVDTTTLVAHLRIVNEDYADGR